MRLLFRQVNDHKTLTPKYIGSAKQELIEESFIKMKSTSLENKKKNRNSWLTILIKIS